VNYLYHRSFRLRRFFRSAHTRCLLLHHLYYPYHIIIMPPKIEGVNTEGLADPTVQPPDAQMLEQATIGSLRTGQHLDINGNLISKWNAVHDHSRRVLTTPKPTQTFPTQRDLAWSDHSTPSGRSRKLLTMAIRGGAQ
jgi:hypothetical protein